MPQAGSRAFTSHDNLIQLCREIVGARKSQIAGEQGRACQQ